MIEDIIISGFLIILHKYAIQSFCRFCQEAVTVIPPEIAFKREIAEFVTLTRIVFLNRAIFRLYSITYIIICSNESA